jgi:hypothetical protein
MGAKCSEHSGCKTDIENNKENIKTIFIAVDKLKNRPPVWMSLLFSLAVGVIGWLAK